MSEPNRHHYLPVFYLKRWADVRGRVWRYYRPRDRVVASDVGPDYTGFEEGLYTLPGIAVPQMIETEFFRVVDNDAAPVLQKILNGELQSLRVGDRRSWTLFLMSMLARSPQFLVEMREVINGFFKANLENAHQADYESSRQPHDPISVYDFTTARRPELAEAYKAALPDMIDNHVIGQHIINMRWAISDLSAAPHTLLAGDRPCMTSHGIADPKCVLSFPVSPTQIFAAVNDVALLHRLALQPARDTVRNSNSCTVRLAAQNVYGCDAGQLTFVENRLRRASDPVEPGLLLRGQLMRM